MDYGCQRADAALGVEPDCRRAERAHLSVSATLDGMVAIDGLLDPIGGSIFVQELRRLEHDLYLADREGGVTSQFNGRLLCTRHNRHTNFRDKNPTPRPERNVLRLDEIQARIR